MNQPPSPSNNNSGTTNNVPGLGNNGMGGQKQQQSIDMIKQYYQQLTSNLRVLTTQLNDPALTPPHRQQLQAQHERLSQNLVDFTDKVLKPLMANMSSSSVAWNPAISSTNTGSTNPGIGGTYSVLNVRPSTSTLPNASSSSSLSTLSNSAMTMMMPRPPSSAYPSTQNSPSKRPSRVPVGNLPPSQRSGTQTPHLLPAFQQRLAQLTSVTQQNMRRAFPSMTKLRMQGFEEGGVTLLRPSAMDLPATPDSEEEEEDDGGEDGEEEEEEDEGGEEEEETDDEGDAPSPDNAIGSRDKRTRSRRRRTSTAPHLHNKAPTSSMSSYEYHEDLARYMRTFRRSAANDLDDQESVAAEYGRLERQVQRVCDVACRLAEHRLDDVVTPRDLLFALRFCKRNVQDLTMVAITKGLSLGLRGGSLLLDDRHRPAFVRKPSSAHNHVHLQRLALIRRHQVRLQQHSQQSTLVPMPMSNMEQSNNNGGGGGGGGEGGD
jgi:hypothetical protein